MLSKRLYFLFGTIAILMTVLVAVILPDSYRWVSFFIIPFVILLVLTYIFSPQVDWWWFQKHPPELPGKMGNLLLQNFQFYQQLTADNKTRFRQRTAMYLEARAFFARRGEEEGDVPLDLKVMIAANAAMMTFGRKDFILKKFERIFIYLQAFPSPDYPYLHASELHEEDECFLFSGEHVMLSFRQPQRFYNVTLHEYVKAFKLTYPKFDYPVFDEKVWSIVPKEPVIQYLGLPEEEVDLFEVGASTFFTKPEKFKEVLPRDFEKLVQIFNVNPLERRDPVVDKSIIEGVP